MPEVVQYEKTLIEMPEIDYESLITEDDEPVDNVFSEKQQRLLVEPLYSSWKPESPFMASANVGVFYSPYQPAIVPDMFLSLDVEPGEDVWKKQNRSYFIWKYEKSPDVVIEIVSNKKGGEADKKMKLYSRMRVWYYVIFDPQQLVQDEMLRIYQLSIGRYVPKEEPFLEEVNLGLTLWDGTYEGLHARWLRWCDADGKLIPTGGEVSKQVRQRAEQEQQRAERLASQLRALGIEPEE